MKIQLKTVIKNKVIYNAKRVTGNNLLNKIQSEF